MVVIGSLVLHLDINGVSCDVNTVTDHNLEADRSHSKVCLMFETACVPLSSNCIQGVFN